LIMKFHLTIFVIFILTFILACSKKGHMEKEPNDSFSTAGEITLDERFLGFMNSSDDRDFYIFHCKQRSILDIELSGVKGLNLAFKVWRGEENPKLIKWVDDNRKSMGERFANLSVIPGTYYIEIFQSDRDRKKANKKDPYELIIRSRETNSGESEPNDSKEEANTIYPGNEIAGYFSPAYNWLNNDKKYPHREEDWYVMDINLKSELPQLMDVSLTGVTGIDSVLYLYDSDDKKIAVADNGGIGEPEAITSIGIKKSGSHYIMVTSKGYMANHEEPYKLKVTLREYVSGTEMEPNNDFETANTITNNVITGKINYKDDIDMFLYHLKESPSICRIELRPPEDMDAILTLYSIDKEKIIDIHNGGRGGKEVYPNFFTEKDFYISVTAIGGDKLPNGEYVLSVTSLTNIANQEQEPNNDLVHANKVNGNTIIGYTSYKRDKDYFLLLYASRTKEKFEVTGVKGGAIKVSITDPMGYIIKSVDIIGDHKVIINETIDKKGYIIVESITENYDYPYTINLDKGQ
jgi:hypothetical protein